MHGNHQDFAFGKEDIKKKKLEENVIFNAEFIIFKPVKTLTKNCFCNYIFVIK